MADTQTIIRQIYGAFNQRNVDAVLSLVTDDVSWPKASEGGRVTGKTEIRAYWTRQWQNFDPQVNPLEILERESGKVAVRVHQRVKNLQGELLFDGEVWHTYTMADGLIERMDLEEEGSSDQTATSAFSRH